MPPTESGLLRYIDYSVNNNGAPNVSIPLYEIKTKELSLPLSLSYDATGIKVSQEAGNVGLAWNLNAGGIINKSIRGMEDNSLSTFWTYTYPAMQKGFNPGSNFDDYDLAMKIINKQVDGMPDLYMYNFNNYSGRFIYGQAGTKYLIPQKKLKIETYGTSEFTGIPYYKITAEDGTKYYFGEVGKSTIRTSYSVSTSGYTWYLTKIESVNSTDEITLEYEDTFYEHFPTVGQSVRMNMGSNCDLYKQPQTYGPSSATNLNSLSRLRGKQLSKITFQEGTVEFNLDWDRQDKRGEESFVRNPKVDGLTIKNKNGQVIKTISFDYDYYNKENTKTRYIKRLRLDAVRFCHTCEPSDPSYAYRFSYNTTPLPPLNSNSVDHWGYYNNQPNETVIPTYPEEKKGICFPKPPYCLCATETSLVRFNGADRTTDPTYVKAGMLEKVEYPTGGNTQFVYQAHEIKSTTYLASLSSSSTSVHLANDALNGRLGEEYSEMVDVPAISSDKLCAEFKVSYSYYPLPSHDHNVQKWSAGGKLVEVLNEEEDTYKTIKSLGLNYKNTSEKFAVLLEPGKKYRLIVYSYLNGASVNGSLIFKHSPVIATQRNYIGGVRLQKKVIEDPLSGKKIVTAYQYGQPYYISPTYQNSQYEYGTTASMCGEPCLGVIDDDEGGSSGYARTHYLNLTANQAGVDNQINYDKITTLDGENGENGKTISHYIVNWQQREHTAFSWQIGQVLDQTVYSASGKELSKTVNDYNYDDPGNGTQENCLNANCTILGVEVSNMGQHPCLFGASQGYFSSYSKFFSIRTYLDVPEWFYLKKTTQTAFDQASNSSLETITDYTYSNPTHLQLTQKATTTSTIGKKIVTTYTYPADYAGIVTGSLAQMQGAKHMHNAVIESLTKVQQGDETKVLGGTFLTYEDIDTNPMDDRIILVPTKAQVVELNSPKLDFVSSLATGTAADNSYQDKQSLKYNALTGNLQEVKLANNITTTYLWGYQHTYPIVEVKNATYQQVAIALAISPAIRFEDESGNPLADADMRANAILLRQRLPQAMLTSYTFDPLIGMTSSTDVAGVTTFFEYDAFQRLKLAKDQDGNIIKHYVYHYKGQSHGE
ncbi:MAG: hypothetical protein V4714_22335 [Bacteroidota bacterium]